MPTGSIFRKAILLCAGALIVGFTSVAAFGQLGTSSYDPESFVRYQGRDYTVTYDGSVSTEPTGHAQVKKIANGKVTLVDITTTPTGTYSSEGMFSRHIRYPGIEVKRVADTDSGVRAHYWARTSGQWVSLPLVDGQSIIHIASGGNTIITANGLSCVLSYSAVIC